MNMIQKILMNENADKNKWNIASDNDQGKFTKSECKDLVNVLQNTVTLGFENVEGMIGGERIIINNFI